MTVMQAILLMASSLHLRKNQIDLVDEGESGPWRNVLIITSFMIWFTLMGIGKSDVNIMETTTQLV